LGQRGDVGEESRVREDGRTVGGVREGSQGEEWGVPSPGNTGSISMGIITCSEVRGSGGAGAPGDEDGVSVDRGGRVRGGGAFL